MVWHNNEFVQQVSALIAVLRNPLANDFAELCYQKRVAISPCLSGDKIDDSRCRTMRQSAHLWLQGVKPLLTAPAIVATKAATPYFEPAVLVFKVGTGLPNRIRYKIGHCKLEPEAAIVVAKAAIPIPLLPLACSCSLQHISGNPASTLLRGSGLQPRHSLLHHQGF